MSELDTKLIKELIEGLSGVVGEIEPFNSEYSKRLTELARSLGMPAIVGSRSPRETDAYDALKFLNRRATTVGQGLSLKSGITDLVKKLKGYPRQTSGYHPSRPGYKNTMLPWSIRQRISRRHPAELAEFRQALDNMGPRVGNVASEEELVEATLESYRLEDLRRQINETGGMVGPSRARDLPYRGNYEKWKAAQDYAADLERKKDARRAYIRNRNKMTEREREIFDRTIEYGGGPEGRRMAEEDIAEERSRKAEGLRRRRRLDRAKERQSAVESFRLDTMDDYEREMRDLTQKYGGDRGMADASLRTQLKKELPVFFKNSKLSTKTLFGISKSFHAIGRVPGMGGLARAALSPVGLSAFAVGLADRILRNIGKSSINATQLQSLVDMAGPMPADFKAASSFLSPEEAQKAWAGILGTFGSLDAARQFGYLKPGLVKTMIAKEYGLDADQMRILSTLAKGTMTPAQRGAAQENLFEVLDRYGMAEGTNLSTKLWSMVGGIPGSRFLFGGSLLSAGADALENVLNDPLAAIDRLPDYQVIQKYGPEVGDMLDWQTRINVGTYGVPLFSDAERGLERMTELIFGGEDIRMRREKALADHIRRLYRQKIMKSRAPKNLGSNVSLLDAIGGAEGAAQSASLYEQIVASSVPPSYTSGDRSVTIRIDNVELTSNNVEELKRGLLAIADSATERLTVANAMKPEYS